MMARLYALAQVMYRKKIYKDVRRIILRKARRVIFDDLSEKLRCERGEMLGYFARLPDSELNMFNINFTLRRAVERYTGEDQGNFMLISVPIKQRYLRAPYYRLEWKWVFFPDQNKRRRLLYS